MASTLHNLSDVDFSIIPNGKDFKIGIVVSEYHFDISGKLLDGCLETLQNNGVLPENIKVVSAPGAFELPVACQRLNRWSNVNAVIAFGCVIKGDTDHDKYINQSVALALQDLAIKYGKPFMFGLLTTNDHQQALDRAGGKHGNKGIEVAAAALRMLALEASLKKE